MTKMERWDIAGKEALTQLLKNQLDLQDKVSDLEGCSGRKNIRIYGIPEEISSPNLVVSLA